MSSSFNKSPSSILKQILKYIIIKNPVLDKDCSSYVQRR